jgi:hypothetical protein
MEIVRGAYLDANPNALFAFRLRSEQWEQKQQEQQEEQDGASVSQALLKAKIRERYNRHPCSTLTPAAATSAAAASAASAAAASAASAVVSAVSAAAVSAADVSAAAVSAAAVSAAAVSAADVFAADVSAVDAETMKYAVVVWHCNMVWHQKRRGVAGAPASALSCFCVDNGIIACAF